MSKSLTVCRDGMLLYQYEFNDGMGSGVFTLLCEVGKPYQAWFIREIKRRKLKVEYGRKLKASPWVADFVKKTVRKKRCPKCRKEVWDVATADQRLNKCWKCGTKWM